MMNDLRNKIYRLTFDQCLKLLHPDSTLFGKESPNVTHDNLLDFINSEGEDGRIVQSVRSGSPDLVNMKLDNKTPIIFMEMGTGGEDFDAPYITQNMEGEMFYIILRVVVRQPNISSYTYEKSAPVQLLTIREQLEYVLDVIHFRGLKSARNGYTMPSFVYNSKIVATEALEGIAPEYDSADYRFAVEMHKQSQRDDMIGAE